MPWLGIWQSWLVLGRQAWCADVAGEACLGLGAEFWKQSPVAGCGSGLCHGCARCLSTQVICRCICFPFLLQIQQWLLSAKSPQITAALGQAQQAQQATKPAPKQPPKQQQQQQQAAPKPAKQPAALKQQQQQASKPAAAKPPAPPAKQPSPAPQPGIPQRARPRKPSPLGPLGAKPAGPATATPAAAAAGAGAGAGAGSAQATPAGAAAKSGASSEDHEGAEATGIEVEVVCNGLKGTFLVDQQLMVRLAVWLDCWMMLTCLLRRGLKGTFLVDQQLMVSSSSGIVLNLVPHGTTGWLWGAAR